jgi:hypothetical protein
MLILKNITVIAIMILLTGFAAGAADGIIVNLSTASCPYADSHLKDKLDTYLSTVEKVPIISDSGAAFMSGKKAARVDFSLLVERGKQLQGRFLVDIMIDRIDLEKRKLTVIPLLMYRYRVYGIVSGTMRIIDIVKNRVVKMEKVYFDLKASDQWQLVDDETNDPALSIPPDDKLILFDRLEEKAAAGLFEEINKLIRGNHFGG